MKKLLAVKKTILLLICIVMAFPVIYYSVYRFNRFNPDINFFTNDEWNKLVKSNIGKYKLIQYIIEETPQNSIILAFHQKDLNYYTKRKTIRHVDPRLVDFYALKDKDKAYDFLIRLGIDYVYLPNYMLPTYFNTQICHVVADPHLCILVREIKGNRLFKLHKTRMAISTIPINIEETDIFRTEHNDLLGRQNYSNTEEYTANGWYLEMDKSGKPVLTIQNNNLFGIYFSSFLGRFGQSTDGAFLQVSIRPEETCHFSASVKGEGILKVLLCYQNDRENVRAFLWESVLTKDYKWIENQFMSMENNGKYRILFALQGKGHLSLREITLNEIYIDN